MNIESVKIQRFNVRECGSSSASTSFANAASASSRRNGLYGLPADLREFATWSTLNVRGWRLIQALETHYRTRRRRHLYRER